MCQINAFNLFVYAEAIIILCKNHFPYSSNVNKQMRKIHNYLRFKFGAYQKNVLNCV